MSRFKKVWIAILAALGVQYARPPMLTHVDHVKVQPQITQSTEPPNLNHPVLTEGKIQWEDGTDPLDSEEEMFHEAVSKANRVLASDCFKRAVLGARFSEAQGKSNDEVYGSFLGQAIIANVEVFMGTRFRVRWGRLRSGEDDSFVGGPKEAIDTPRLQVSGFLMAQVVVDLDDLAGTGLEEISDGRTRIFAGHELGQQARMSLGQGVVWRRKPDQVLPDRISGLGLLCLVRQTRGLPGVRIRHLQRRRRNRK